MTKYIEIREREKQNISLSGKVERERVKEVEVSINLRISKFVLVTQLVLLELRVAQYDSNLNRRQLINCTAECKKSYSMLK